MPESWIIVDGYNLLARRGKYHGRSLEQARHELIRACEPLLGDAAERITLVFDGRSERAQADSEAGVEVVFSGGHLSADGMIGRLVQSAKKTDDILVVSSDRFVRDAAEAAGAHTMASGLFFEQASMRPRNNAPCNRGFKSTLGDLFPKNKGENHET